MNNDWPCICGCTFDNHAKLSFEGSKTAIHYCRDCMRPPSWCYSYTPIDNLSYLEWKFKTHDTE